MRILLLNWRDIRNPAAGGAEVVTYEIARRWVQWGHQVTWFTAGFPGGVPEEEIAGIQIIRRGRQYSVHYQAFRHYRQSLRGKFDLVIDEVNTIPFFTPLYVTEPKVAFIHQLAREVWLYESRFPVNLLGYRLEPCYLRTYRNTPSIVVSESTWQDLNALGFRKVHVVLDGVGVAPLAEVPSRAEKAGRPTVLYIGRVVPSKRVTDVVQAVHLLRAQVPQVQLWIVGKGEPDYIAQLQCQAEEYGLARQVRFWGRVSAAQKLELFRSAHVVALASVREGWGLVVIEANAVGTPAVVYRVPGLVDSVQDETTGLVCRENTAQNMAEQLCRVLLDIELQERLSQQALEWSRQFTWERNAREFLSVLVKVLGGKAEPH